MLFSYELWNRVTIFGGATLGGVYSIETSKGLVSRTFDSITSAKFTLLHEYAHHIGIRDEVTANDFALGPLGLLP